MRNKDFFWQRSIKEWKKEMILLVFGEEIINTNPYFGRNR